ncbi:hypothetical protein ASE08_13815 [Rhizobacter sp. Root16D2]|nr:hypothetical protein ASC98_06310 [Rhizobacter sp. Root1238]KRB03779.1 hypothetical protein ASE08_13815 [Rhizobacter sp. Root16D2]
MLVIVLTTPLPRGKTVGTGSPGADPAPLVNRFTCRCRLLTHCRLPITPARFSTAPMSVSAPDAVGIRLALS